MLEFMMGITALLVIGSILWLDPMLRQSPWIACLCFSSSKLGLAQFQGAQWVFSDARFHA